MARVSPEFIDRALELQGTVRARASAAESAWALRTAAHTGEDAFDALARRVMSSPVRVAGVLSGEHDPLLLCALAGKRSMEDLAGVTPAGGRSNAAPTVVESLAARRVQQHWELCRTDPERAKRLEAKWAASRATMRSGHLGPALSAMEATYGAACSAEREAAQGRLVSTVPPATWDPAGAHAGKLAGYGSVRWNRMRGQAVAETQMPAEWRHRRTRSEGPQRPRARFVARGAGRVEQLADARFSPRMAASRIAFQVRLKLAMARGPGATRRFLTSVASNPRRAAAAVRARLDPMVVAAAIGPKAIEGMLAGKPVRESGPLGRLQDELHKRDVARLQNVRQGPDGGVADVKAQRDALDGGIASAKGMREASARFVDKVWQGDNRAGAAGGGWSADSALGEQFQQGSVDGSVYDAWRARREAVVEGAAAEQLQERFGPDRKDLSRARGEAARDSGAGDDWARGETGRVPREGSGVPPMEQPAAPPPQPTPEIQGPGISDPIAGSSQPLSSSPPRPPAPPTGPGMSDPIPGRPQPHPDSQEVDLSGVRDGQWHSGVQKMMSVPAGDVDRSLSVHPEQADKFKLVGEDRDGKRAWEVRGDLEVDTVYQLPDGSYDVVFKQGCVPTDAVGEWAAGQVDARVNGRFVSQDRGSRSGSEDYEWARVDSAVLSSDVEKLKERFDSLGGADAGYRLRTEKTQVAQPGGYSREMESTVLERWQPRERSQPDHAPPGVGSSPVPGASIVIPADALRDVEVKEEDLPKMTQEAEPPPDGSWKVHDDDRIDRVIPREDGSYEVRFKPGVAALPEGLAEEAASETHKRRTDPQLVELQNERTAQTVELERAARETLADAVERGRAPFDVERAGYMPGQATNAFSREGIDGVDGDLLRAKAIREGAGHDLRFATREQIEAAGGRVSPDAEGVIVMREVAVSAQPFGEDGKVDRKADPVEYRVKSPQVLYHVSSETDLARGQVPSQPLAAPVREMTAEDLCKSVGVDTREMPHPAGRSEFQPANPKLNVPEDTIVIAKDGGESVAERNGRLVGAAVRATLSPNRSENDSRSAPPKGAYSSDAAKAKQERRLVEVMAADRAAGRIGVAYRTSPPVTAKERKQFAQMLKNPQVRERLGKEIDRVSSWVADGAQQRLNDRGVQTVHQRAQGVPPPARPQGRPEGWKIEEPVPGR